MESRPKDVRYELLKLSLKKVVARNGLPAEFLTAEIASGQAQGRPVLHVRLVARSADPRLLANLFDIQQAFEQQVACVDPASRDWLTGVSWRLERHDLDPATSLPPAAYWQEVLADRRLQAIQDGRLKRTREELDSEFSVFTRTGAFQLNGDFTDTEPTRW